MFPTESRCWFILCTLVLSVTSLQAQSATPDASSNGRRFQSNVGIVIVDAVVTDSKDELVTGLKAKDFQIFEDKKRQTISVLEEHTGIQVKPTKLPPMPPDVYTNFPPIKTADSVNVLLLDALNTQVSDQSYVRLQLIRYLKNIQPGTRLAVFVLTSQLRMIQAVTTDSSVLLAALDSQALGGGPQQSPMLLSNTEVDVDKVQNAELMQNLAGETQKALDAMAHRGFAYMKEFKLDSRVETTLQGLQQLARYLAGIPGRKNLIWFSGSFPISVFPDLSAADAFQAVREYGGEVQRTATLLTLAQVAIYPITAEGVVSDSQYEADAAEIGKTRALQTTPGLSGTINLNSSHLSMEVLAENTGGKAFYNTNGLTDALARAINYGSHYYTLTYTPTDKKMDGRYRRIQLKLSSSKYTVAYRRGYYAGDTHDAKAKKEQRGDPLLPLMKRGLPDLAQIVYKIRVTPSNPQPSPEAERAGDGKELKGPFTRYGVDFAVAVEDLALAPSTDGLRSGDIELMLVAYDRDGEALNFIIRKRSISLNSQTYAAAQAAGLQMHYEIDVPRVALNRNQVYLRAGICDLRTNNAGTLEVSLHPVTTAAVTAK